VSIAPTVAVVTTNVATVNRVQFSSAAIGTICSTVCNAIEKWEPLAGTAEVWTEVDPASEIWQDASSVTDSWSAIPPTSETWTDASAASETWADAA
jgi:hypothetical protein